MKTTPYTLPQKCALCPIFPPPFLAKDAERIRNPMPKAHPGILNGIKKNMMGRFGCMVIAEKTTAETAPEAPRDL